MNTYKIIRFYRSASKYGHRVIKRGLTLEEAQAHCRNNETSSRTCTTSEARRRTARLGEWFDGYDLER